MKKDKKSIAQRLRAAKAAFVMRQWAPCEEAAKSGLELVFRQQYRDATKETECIELQKNELKEYLQTAQKELAARDGKHVMRALLKMTGTVWFI